MGPVTRRASAAFGDRAIPRGWALDTRAHADAHPELGISVRTAWPALELRRSVPDGAPDGYRGLFERQQGWEIGERIGASIPHGRVYGAYGAVIAPDNTLLFDLSPAHNAPTPDRHRVFRRLRLPAAQRVDGAVATLATRGMHNYYHFLMDALPRIHLLRLANFGDEPGAYVVDARSGWQRELLERAGVAPERTIDPARTRHLQAERLLAASVPGGAWKDPRWVADWLGSLFADVAPGDRERIYLSRGTTLLTRRVRNEDEVTARLARLGFETVVNERLSVAEQAGLYKGARVIVAPHGAGLSNLVFCRPGTTVIEIFSPQWLNLAFWKLAAQLDDVRYLYLMGRGAPPPDMRQRDVGADIDVDLRQLDEVLELAGVR